MRTAEEIADDLADHGIRPTDAEVIALCAAAAACDLATAKLDAIDDALRGVGLAVADVTTDDDDGVVLEIMRLPSAEDQ